MPPEITCLIADDHEIVRGTSVTITVPAYVASSR